MPIEASIDLFRCSEQPAPVQQVRAGAVPVSCNLRSDQLQGVCVPLDHLIACLVYVHCADITHKLTTQQSNMGSLILAWP